MSEQNRIVTSHIKFGDTHVTLSVRENDIVGKVFDEDLLQRHLDEVVDNIKLLLKGGLDLEVGILAALKIKKITL